VLSMWYRRCCLRGIEADCIMLERFAFFVTYWISYHSACLCFKIKFPTSPLASYFVL